MRAAIVIPCGEGRQDNLIACLETLERQTIRPEGVVLIHDGEGADPGQVTGMTIPVVQVVTAAKHVPGMEQPRNVGVRQVERHYPQADHVWFVDTDLLFEENCLEAYYAAHLEAAEDRILIGPYEWMPLGARAPQPELYNDPRWVSFTRYTPADVLRDDLGAGLACFSGNLVWPIADFKAVGGFWNEIHHGRCEDGELGLRATAMGIPISFVREARGWHMAHPVNPQLAAERNARDVPMLNARHPWVEGEGLAVVPKDGRRFDAKCPTCHEMVNTIEMWTHVETCGKPADEGILIPEEMP